MELTTEHPKPHLDLSLGVHRDRTFIERQFSRYPFHICRPLYVDNHPRGMATVYVQSCAGGIFSGDQLRVRVRAQAHSQTHLTSQASTVIHRMTGSSAVLDTSVQMEEGAFVEYLPDPVILFPEADLTSRFSLQLNERSVAIFSDSFLMYDPYHQGKYFSNFTNETSVYNSDNELLCRDRTSVSGLEVAEQNTGIIGTKTAVGTFYYLHSGQDVDRMHEKLSDSIQDVSTAYVGVSTLPSEAGIWARIIASEVADLRHAMEYLWFAAREHATGHRPLKRKK
jgi:urease accessory protein